MGEYEIIDATETVEVLEDEDVEANVHEVTIHDDGVEVIVDFDDTDDSDDDQAVGTPDGGAGA